MAVPSTGAVGISDIVAEFGGTSPDSLSEYYAGGGLVPSGATGNNGAVPTSGTISIDDLRGSVNSSPITATGGSVSDSGGYRYHTFTSGGTFEVTATAAGSFSNSIDVLIIAGGAGGRTYNDNAPGGGAGGMVEESFTASVTSLSVSVGSAGAVQGMGNNSSVTGRTTAIRGGYLANGGSGSGSPNSGYYNGTSGQGNRGGRNSTFGGASGGGGGRGGVGGDGRYYSSPNINGSGGGNGGSGKAWLNGVTYCGGGGAGHSTLYYDYYGTYIYAIGCGNGGSGGGGRGGGIQGYDNNNGGANYRNSTAGSQYGAAGGGGGDGRSGSGGYQGVVIFRYEYS